MTTTIEREESTMRVCCETIEKHGALTIVDLISLTNLNSAAIRFAVNRAVKLGYLQLGKKKVGNPRGNARKMYERTHVDLPGIKVRAEPVIVQSEFAPRRHWQDVAFYGPYEKRA